jgi:hypothetical protein
VIHQKMRLRFAELVASGLAVCARCELPIDPTDPWDLDHRDDRTGLSRPVAPPLQPCDEETAQGVERLVSGGCDVCGGPKGAKLTAADRRKWPSIARWIRHACLPCRKRFKRNAEKATAT